MKLSITKSRAIMSLAVVGVSTGLLLATYLTNRLINQPARGVISRQTLTESAESPAPSLITVHGRTALFQHPANFQPTAPDKLGAQDVEKFSFVNRQIPASNLTIQIRKLPTASLKDDSAYAYRKLHPEQYANLPLTVSDQSVPILADQSGGFNQVAFLAHGQLVAEIALNSGDSSQTGQLRQVLAAVVTSWHWL